jgi:hypothetical protein
MKTIFFIVVRLLAALLANRLETERLARPHWPAGRVDHRLIAEPIDRRHRLARRRDERLVAERLKRGRRCRLCETRRLPDKPASIRGRRRKQHRGGENDFFHDPLCGLNCRRPAGAVSVGAPAAISAVPLLWPLASVACLQGCREQHSLCTSRTEPSADPAAQRDDARR